MEQKQSHQHDSQTYVKHKTPPFIVSFWGGGREGVGGVSKWASGKEGWVGEGKRARGAAEVGLK